MKKNIIILAGGLSLALAFQGCQQKADMSVFNGKIDSLATIKTDEYRAQLMQECTDKVKAAAALRADSLIAAASKGGKKTTSKPTPPPPPPPTPENKDPKAGKMGGNQQTGTEQKGNKMSGNENKNTGADSKKDKMSGKKPQ